MGRRPMSRVEFLMSDEFAPTDRIATELAAKLLRAGPDMIDAPPASQRRISPRQRESDRPRASARPPAILLGGDTNALSVARELHQRGVVVYVLASPDSSAKYSRCCRSI